MSIIGAAEFVYSGGIGDDGVRTLQTARPNGSFGNSNWSASGTPSGPGEHNYINEVTANDTNYLYTTTQSTASVIGFTLPTTLKPAIGSPHKIYCRVSTLLSAPSSLSVALYQGGTAIAVTTFTDTNSTFETEVFTLSDTQAGNITDYSGLSLVVGWSSSYPSFSQMYFTTGPA